MDARIGLGVALFESGDRRRAEDAFREALRINPYEASAHGDLGRLLSANGDLVQAVWHFARAVQLRPGVANYLYEYALVLTQLDQFEEAQIEVTAAIKADQNLAEGHELLGGLLARKKQMDAALQHFREAVRIRPEFSRAQLDYGATLVLLGDIPNGEIHLRLAARGTDPQVAAQARHALSQLDQ